MSKGWFSLASPIWANYANEKGLPISCNGSYVADDMYQILGKAAEVGAMTKNGAGTSAYFGDLRPRGATISSGGKSSGPVHFMELFDSVANIVSQSNVRRGAFAAYFSVEHQDIDEFLTVRSEGHPIQHISIGVCISDKWMQEMIDGSKENRKIWTKIIQKRFESGYPYIMFVDTVNNNSPQVYKDKGIKIYASNLCVAPETLILTRNGHEIISELEGEDIEIWNGTQWSKTTIVKTGQNQQLYKVTLSDGKTLSCTEYHKWFIFENYDRWRKGLFGEKRTNQLKIGDKLIKFNSPIIDGNETFKYPYAHGAFCGDGAYESSGRPRLSLYGEKEAILPYLDCEIKNNGRDSVGRLNIILSPDLPRKFLVPHNTSISTKLKWLEGYLDMDGTVAFSDENESLQAVSVEFNFLNEIQLMLQTLGVNAKVVHMADAGYRFMPDGNGGSKEYWCRESKRLLITSIGLYQLFLLGFSPKRLKISGKLPQREASQFAKVVSIEKIHQADTYCVNEPLKHMAVFNGILTGNCSEICLSSSESESFVCDLSSLNLLHYDDWKDTDAVEILTYFLDAVMTDYIRKIKDIPFMGAAYSFALSQRALGIGVLGWHSYLQSKMIAFESMEAKLINPQIYKLIKEKTLKASKEMAIKYGEPSLLKGYGLRNTTTMAIAPTTSSSFILGQVSPSIEPLNSNYFVKDLEKGKFTYKNPYLKDVLARHERDTKETWDNILVNDGSVQHLSFLDQNEKEVFKTFGEISQKEIVIQAAQRQKYIDQSQSLNLMIHPDASPKEVSQLLIEGWRLGIKTFYYQRGTNPAQQLGRSILSCVSCEA